MHQASFPLCRTGRADDPTQAAALQSRLTAEQRQVQHRAVPEAAVFVHFTAQDTDATQAAVTRQACLPSLWQLPCSTLQTEARARRTTWQTPLLQKRKLTDPKSLPICRLQVQFYRQVYWLTQALAAMQALAQHRALCRPIPSWQQCANRRAARQLRVARLHQRQ